MCKGACVCVGGWGGGFVFQKTLPPLFLSRLQAEFTVHFDDACSRAEFTVHFDDACSRAEFTVHFDDACCRARVVTQNTPRGALSQLTLRPALRNDTGFYTCNAKNKFGHGALVSNLVVNG